MYAKEKNVPQDKLDQMVGDVWTWTAIDADSKLVINWTLGSRDAETGLEFMQGVAKRLKNRVQLTSDGYKTYLYAVDHAFEGDIDFAQLVKTYGSVKGDTPQTRYSPAACTGAKKEPVTGSPNPRHISTSYVERQNLLPVLQLGTASPDAQGRYPGDGRWPFGTCVEHRGNRRLAGGFRGLEKFTKIKLTHYPGVGDNC